MFLWLRPHLMQNRHTLHFCSDQSVCGSCWSFGTTGTIEGAYFLKYGHQVRLSQQVRFIVVFFLGLWLCTITLDWRVKNQSSDLYEKQVRQQSHSVIIIWHFCVVCRTVIVFEKWQVCFIQWHCHLLKLYNIGNKWINYWNIAFFETRRWISIQPL